MGSFYQCKKWQNQAIFSTLNLFGIAESAVSLRPCVCLGNIGFIHTQPKKAENGLILCTCVWMGGATLRLWFNPVIRAACPAVLAPANCNRVGRKNQKAPVFRISVKGLPTVRLLHLDMSQTFLTCFWHTFAQYAVKEKTKNCTALHPPLRPPHPTPQEKLAELQHIVARLRRPTIWCGESKKQQLIKNLKGWWGSECMSVKTHTRQLINF